MAGAMKPVEKSFKQEIEQLRRYLNSNSLDLASNIILL